MQPDTQKASQIIKGRSRKLPMESQDLHLCASWGSSWRSWAPSWPQDAPQEAPRAALGVPLGDLGRHLAPKCSPGARWRPPDPPRLPFSKIFKQFSKDFRNMFIGFVTCCKLENLNFEFQNKRFRATTPNSELKVCTVAAFRA